MKKFCQLVMKALLKNGTVIAGCAFAFAFVAANSSCILPFYEPEEPKGLESLKKFR